MIKKTITTLCTVLLLTGMSAAQSTTLTLDSVLSATRQNYPTLSEGDLTRATGKALREALWYAYIPQLSLEGRAHHQSDVTSVEMKVKETPEGEKPSPMDGMLENMLKKIEMPTIPKFQYDAYAQVSQLLWDGGRIAAGTRQVDANTSVQLAQQQQELEQVAEGVQELYFGLLMLDAQTRAQQVMIDELSRQEQRVSNALRNGVATQNDYDEVKLEMISARQTMETLHESRAAVLSALSIYMGRELDEGTTAALPATPLVAEDSAVTASAGELRFAPKKSTHTLLDARGDLAKAEYSSALAKGMPTIALFARGGYGRPGLNMLNPDPQSYFMYGATFSWNIGELYSLGKRRQVRDHTLRLLELKREAFELTTRAKVVEQQKEVRQYRRLVDRDKEILDLRKRISDRAEVQAEAGTITTTERLQKLSAYTVARQTYEAHRIQLLRALYRVKTTIGE